MSKDSTRGTICTSAGWRSGLSNTKPAGAGTRGPLDLATPLDAALDQVPRGEADVAFEGIDLRGVQLVAERGHVRRHADIDAADGLAGERAFVDRLRRRQGFEGARARCIGLTQIEMRALPIVAHQKWDAILQSAV